MFTFCKEERLTNKKIINSIFTKGNSAFIYPFNVKWSFIESKSEFPLQILITIPKRNFKKAVDRNKLKRCIREAYRLNKNIFSNKVISNDKKIVFTLIYTEKEILNFKMIQEKIILVLHRLVKEHEKNIG